MCCVRLVQAAGPRCACAACVLPVVQAGVRPGAQPKVKTSSGAKRRIKPAGPSQILYIQMEFCPRTLAQVGAGETVAGLLPDNMHALKLAMFHTLGTQLVALAGSAAELRDARWHDKALLLDRELALQLSPCCAVLCCDAIIRCWRLVPLRRLMPGWC